MPQIKTTELVSCIPIKGEVVMDGWMDGILTCLCCSWQKSCYSSWLWEEIWNNKTEKNINSFILSKAIVIVADWPPQVLFWIVSVTNISHDAWFVCYMCNPPPFRIWTFMTVVSRACVFLFSIMSFRHSVRLCLPDKPYCPDQQTMAGNVLWVTDGLFNHFRLWPNSSARKHSAVSTTHSWKWTLKTLEL